MNARSSVARHTWSYEAILARLASTTPATGLPTVLAAHLHKHAHRAGNDLTTDASLEDLVRPVRIRAQGLDEALARSTDLISERTRALIEAVSATAWAGHVAPYLPGREQLLAAIAVYRDRYDAAHPSPLGPRPVEAEPARLATWTDLAFAPSADRADAPDEQPDNDGPDFEDWGPEEAGPTGP